MTTTSAVYLEQTPKWTFAGAIEWPGWCRRGRDEAEALAALVTYGPRYAKALTSHSLQFEAPAVVSALEILERLPGNSGTDFGVPAVWPSGDARPLNTDELERQIAILEASWQAFDQAAAAARGLDLRKGPRGGGRDLDKIVAHALGGEQAYLRELGGTFPKMPD